MCVWRGTTRGLILGASQGGNHRLVRKGARGGGGGRQRGQRKNSWTNIDEISVHTAAWGGMLIRKVSSLVLKRISHLGLSPGQLVATNAKDDLTLASLHARPDRSVRTKGM